MPGFEHDTRWPEEGKEFRLAWWILSLGIVAVCLFGAFGIFSVHAAWTNADGDFRYPVPTAIIFAVILSFFTLLSTYFILAYCRERLILNTRFIRHVGVFRTRDVDLATVERVVWELDGTVKLHNLGKAKISLFPYGARNRAEIVRHLREQLDETIQEGWEKFEPIQVPGGNSWGRRREQGQTRFVWVQNVLPALCLGAGFVLKDWFKHPVDYWQLGVPWLMVFGIGGYFVGLRRWKTNEAIFRATDEAQEPFDLPGPNADHSTWLAIGVALLMLIPMGFASYFLIQKMNEGSWQRSYDAGRWALGEGRPAEAERYLKRAVAVAESFGERDGRLADSLSSLATAYGRQAKNREAESLFRRALAIREQVFGPDHPEVAHNLNDLAWIDCNQGDYADAERLSRRALAIREKALGHEDIVIGRNLEDLAWFLYRQGKYSESEELLKKSSAILERSGEAGRYDLAACLNRLAVLDRALGKLDEARPIFERALAIRESILGPGHPDVAESLSNLATVLRDLGRRDEARPLYERAIGIFENALGPQHPGLALPLIHLGRLESTEGHEDKAEALMRRALSVQEKTLGPNHPDITLSLGQLAILDLKRNRDAEARTMAGRALAILESSQGIQPTEIARDLDTLAQIDTREGKYAEAESRFKKALEIREKALPGNHPDIAEVQEHYAALLRKCERTHEAEAMERRAKATRGKQMSPVK